MLLSINYMILIKSYIPFFQNILEAIEISFIYIVEIFSTDSKKMLISGTSSSFKAKSIARR